MKKTAYVGIDYHIAKLTIAVKMQDQEDFYSTIHLENKTKVIANYLKKLSEQFQLKICYEASGSGYHFQRLLKSWNYHCDVIAPSLIPKKAGDRRKNDFRDARELARNYASSQLTVVHSPTQYEEAVRSVVRCRLDFKENEKRTKQHINSLLIAQGQHWQKSKWTLQHRTWILQLSFSEPFVQQVLQEHLAHLEYLETCIARLDHQIEEIAALDTYAPSVKKLRALKGLGTLSAMILIAEITDFRRFASPRALMSFLGLIPAEDSSGPRCRYGSITKAGNRRCRTQLIESVRHYIKQPRMSRQMKADCAQVDPASAGIVQKCMQRLHKRYWALTMKGKTRNVALVAIAREFVGFIGALMTSNDPAAQAA
jgi:transposase